MRPSRIVPLLVLAAPLSGAAGQDVEMLGERYGTPVPEAYERMREADPAAFTFRRGLRGGRGLELRTFDGGSGGAPALTLGPRENPVLGDYRIPVVLGLYENSAALPPFDRSTIQQAYFGTGQTTITAYYQEASNSRANLIGEVMDWVRTARPDTDYTAGESGLVSGSLGGRGAGNFVYEVLELQSGIDWGRYDNDGPDGIPDSGDDDGFVDVLAVMHPTRGAECGGSGQDDRIWSHRWSLSAAVGTSFVTSTPSASGGFIKVDDYIIQPTLSCGSSDLNEIGVFTHELGHAFGLPDLYDTCDDLGCPDDAASTSGAGVWDLMASGSWGCNNASPDRPCHMGAWTKAQLGWVDVVALAPDSDHGTITIPPVIGTGTVYRIDAGDGSGEYFLLENRQRLGFDQNLYREGLLIWQIDPDWVAARWRLNRVNANEHQGVWLRQADGDDDLGNGIGRGDADDPFPGASGNTAFHAATTPGSISFGGGVTGVTLVDIQQAGDDISLRAATRFSTVTVVAQGTTTPTGLLTVDGQQVDPPASVTSAPFVTHDIAAAVGETVAPGERRPFIEWLDDPGASRSRTVATPINDSTFVASYGGTEYELALTTSGGQSGVEPATFESTPASPDLWFAQGADVSLQASPRTGFSFLGWSGDLTGQGNPALFTMNGPLAAGADFEIVYRIADAVVDLPAATELEVQLAVESGNDPVRWSVVDGALPLGTRLSGSGLISGAALDVGTFEVTVEAVDAIGLSATASLALEVATPVFSIEQLASPFLLSGPELTDPQITFLDHQGNGVAPYDIGDFRAWVLADPSLPLSAEVDGVHRRTIVIGSAAAVESSR